MAISSAGREVAVIDVEGMSCQNCVRHVRAALSGVAGVEKVDVSLEKNEAQIVYAPQQVSIAQLMQAVNDAGYAAKGFTRGEMA